MKWLLITNNRNPGDIWVRLGVQEIILRLDTNPTFLLRERDRPVGDSNPSLTAPGGGFDYAVLCGMPLLWSHHQTDGTIYSTLQHDSWPALTSWCSEANRLIVAGFGIYLLCPNGIEQFKIADESNVVHKIQKLFDRCLGAYSRSPLAQRFFPQMERFDCPSIWALPKVDRKDLKLCNFMPGGSHYPTLEPEASSVIEKKMLFISNQLLSKGFTFAAHNPQERQLARSMAWPEDRILGWASDGSGTRLCDAYARCCKYIGNRIHGGIMARAAGADTIVIGYDTRLADVEVMGGQVFTPSQLPDLTPWIESEPHGPAYDLDGARAQHLNWWSSKLNLPIQQRHEL